MLSSGKRHNMQLRVTSQDAEVLSLFDGDCEVGLAMNDPHKIPDHERPLMIEVDDGLAYICQNKCSSFVDPYRYRSLADETAAQLAAVDDTKKVGSHGILTSELVRANERHRRPESSSLHDFVMGVKLPLYHSFAWRTAQRIEKEGDFNYNLAHQVGRLSGRALALCGVAGLGYATWNWFPASLQPVLAFSGGVALSQVSSVLYEAFRSVPLQQEVITDKRNEAYKTLYECLLNEGFTIARREPTKRLQHRLKVKITENPYVDQFRAVELLAEDMAAYYDLQSNVIIPANDPNDFSMYVCFLKEKS